MSDDRNIRGLERPRAGGFESHGMYRHWGECKVRALVAGARVEVVGRDNLCNVARTSPKVGFLT